MALPDADGGGQAAQFRIEEVDRFFLDDVIDFLIELEVVGMDGVDRNLRAADEFHLRRIAGLAQGIDLERFLEHLRRKVGLAMDEETAQRDPVDVRGGMRDEVFAAVFLMLGEFALVAGRDDQVLSALALIEAVPTHIDDEAEERIVDIGWTAIEKRGDLASEITML